MQENKSKAQRIYLVFAFGFVFFMTFILMGSGLDAVVGKILPSVSSHKDKGALLSPMTWMLVAPLLAGLLFSCIRLSIKIARSKK